MGGLSLGDALGARTWDTWGNCSSLSSDFDGTPANTHGTFVSSHYLAGS